MKKLNLETDNYSEFVGIIKERNRPSGGIRSVHEVSINARIDSSKKMLEIGSNTGFTCVNMSLLTSCHSTGIDVNEESVKESEMYAKEQGVEKLTKFVVAKAEKLPFEDESFDIVWCSNVTSFIEDKQAAIKEYLRVLKPKGVLVLIPIYYRKIPSEKLVKEVSKAVGTNIKVWDKKFWSSLFEGVGGKIGQPIELFYDKDFKYKDRTKVIESYSEELMKKEHIKKMSEKEQKIVKERILYFMNLFNENLKFAGFTIFLFQKRNIIDELELFKSEIA